MFVETKPGLQFCNEHPLRVGIDCVLSDERFKLLGRNADIDGRPAHAAADRDAAALSPHRRLLRLRAWRQRQGGDTQYDRKSPPWAHNMNHSIATFYRAVPLAV